MKFQSSAISLINHAPNHHPPIPDFQPSNSPYSLLITYHHLYVINSGTKSVTMEMFVTASINENTIDNHLNFRHLIGNLASGAVAGCVVEAGQFTLNFLYLLIIINLALYPIDTIKTRLQALNKGGIKALLKIGSIGKLYSGLLGNLAGVAPATGLFFAVYEPVKTESAKYISKELSPFVAATSAAIASSLIRVPTEVVKQRMQTGQFNSAIKAVINYLVLNLISHFN